MGRGAGPRVPGHRGRVHESTATRCDTARIIADVAGIDDVVDLPGLVNLHYGEWEALTSREAAAHNPIEFGEMSHMLTERSAPAARRST